jgi:hypothetical protein
LFADEHDAGAAASFSENGLCSFQPKITGLTVGGGIF